MLQRLLTIIGSPHTKFENFLSWWHFKIISLILSRAKRYVEPYQDISGSIFLTIIKPPPPKPFSDLVSWLSIILFTFVFSYDI